MWFRRVPNGMVDETHWTYHFHRFFEDLSGFAVLWIITAAVSRAQRRSYSVSHLWTLKSDSVKNQPKITWAHGNPKYPLVSNMAGKSPNFFGKSAINGPFSIAMFDYRMVFMIWSGFFIEFQHQDHQGWRQWQKSYCRWLRNSAPPKGCLKHVETPWIMGCIYHPLVK